MAIMRVADALRNQQADQITALIDAGTGSGTISFYTGTMPADADDALTGQTLLATLTFSDPSAGPAVGGVLTFDAITEDSSADNSGTATWARLRDSDGNNVLDIDITGVAGGGTIEMNTTTIAAGGPVRISSFSINVPVGSVT